MVQASSPRTTIVYFGTIANAHGRVRAAVSIAVDPRRRVDPARGGGLPRARARVVTGRTRPTYRHAFVDRVDRRCSGRARVRPVDLSRAVDPARARGGPRRRLRRRAATR